jgi:hypothetical protein
VSQVVPIVPVMENKSRLDEMACFPSNLAVSAYSKIKEDLQRLLEGLRGNCAAMSSRGRLDMVGLA